MVVVGERAQSPRGPRPRGPAPPRTGELGWTLTTRTATPPMSIVPAGMELVSMGSRLPDVLLMGASVQMPLRPPLLMAEASSEIT